MTSASLTITQRENWREDFKKSVVTLNMFLSLCRRSWREFLVSSLHPCSSSFQSRLCGHNTQPKYQHRHHNLLASDAPWNLCFCVYMHIPWVLYFTPMLYLSEFLNLACFPYFMSATCPAVCSSWPMRLVCVSSALTQSRVWSPWRAIQVNTWKGAAIRS